MLLLFRATSVCLLPCVAFNVKMYLSHGNDSTESPPRAAGVILPSPEVVFMFLYSTFFRLLAKINF